MTVLRTPRATLRPFTAADAERLFDLRRRPDVARWLGDPTPWPDLATTHDRIAEWQAVTSADDPFGVWAIAPDDGDPVAGHVSLRRLPDLDEVEVGWTLHPDATGHGWAREAAAAVLAHATGEGVARVWAIMWAHNDASARVARALGLHDHGVRRDPWYGTDADPWSLMFCTDPTAADDLDLPTAP